MKNNYLHLAIIFFALINTTIATAQTWTGLSLELTSNNQPKEVMMIGDKPIIRHLGVMYYVEKTVDNGNEVLVLHEVSFVDQNGNAVSFSGMMFDGGLINSNGYYEANSINESYQIQVTQVLDNNVDLGIYNWNDMNYVEILGSSAIITKNGKVFVVDKNTGDQIVESYYFSSTGGITGMAQYTIGGETFVVATYNNDGSAHFVRINEDGSWSELGSKQYFYVNAIDDDGNGNLYCGGSYNDGTIHKGVFKIINFDNSIPQVEIAVEDGNLVSSSIKMSINNNNLVVTDKDQVNVYSYQTQNNAPEVVSMPAGTATAGTDYSSTIIFSDPENDPITINIGEICPELSQIIELTDNGNGAADIFISGNDLNSVQTGDYTYTINFSDGTNDASIELTLYIENTVGLLNLQSENNILIINPVTNNTIQIINHTAFENNTVEIISINGQKLGSYTVSASIPLKENYPSGIYFLQFNNSRNQHFTQKIIIR